MRLKNIRERYKRSRFIRIMSQLLMLLVIYFSVRYWLSIEDIEGKAPVVYAQMLNGEYFDLREHQSKPVLIHFWATWCPICQFENSNIEALAKDYQVITIASWSEGAREIAEYMNQENLTMPVIVDEDAEWAKLYGVKAVPTSFIVDGDGVIKFVEKGYSSETGLRLRMWFLQH